MLFRESYEFTCLIIAIFGKDCQVFFPYLAIIFLFFSTTKNSGTQCPEKEMTAFTPFPIVLARHKFSRPAGYAFAHS